VPERLGGDVLEDEELAHRRDRETALEAAGAQLARSPPAAQ